MSIEETESTIVFAESQESCLFGALALYRKNKGGTVILLESHFYYYPPGADPDEVGAENLGEVFDKEGQSQGTIYQPLTQRSAISLGGQDRTVFIEGLTKRPFIMDQLKRNK